MRRAFFIVLLLAMTSYFASTPVMAATGKCMSVQAQCAVEIGGQCDPKTGHWSYGPYQGHQSGGTNHGGAFDACISRKLGQGR
jgi:hypothetical protein